jgi:predicted lipoprotein
MRRSLVLVVVALAVCGAAFLHGAGRADSNTRPTAATKQLALDTVATRVLRPAYADLAAKSAQFSAAADRLTSAPSLATLKETQQAWKDVLTAWRRTQPFAHGPIADLGLYSRIQFWPSRRQSVDRVLRAARPIDATYLQELGANSVGLSALEIMLFDVRQDDAMRVAAFSGPQGERQRQYFRALAGELAAKTRLVQGAWEGPTGYGAGFAAGGQNQLNLLVNDLLQAIELGAENRLRVVLERNTEPQFRTDIVEGGLSGTSQQGLIALLAGARAAFTAGGAVGLDDYLTELKSPTGKRIDAQFQRAIDAVQALGGPLEQAIQQNPLAVKRAYDECRALEIMMKTEVVSALGVTLTFKSKDGD